MYDSRLAVQAAGRWTLDTLGQLRRSRPWGPWSLFPMRDTKASWVGSTHSVVFMAPWLHQSLTRKPSKHQGPTYSFIIQNFFSKSVRHQPMDSKKIHQANVVVLGGWAGRRRCWLARGLISLTPEHARDRTLAMAQPFAARKIYCLRRRGSMGIDSSQRSEDMDCQPFAGSMTERIDSCPIFLLCQPKDADSAGSYPPDLLRSWLYRGLGVMVEQHIKTQAESYKFSHSFCGHAVVLIWLLWPTCHRASPSKSVHHGELSP